jgi:hypothetical protein
MFQFLIKASWAQHYFKVPYIADTFTKKMHITHKSAHWQVATCAIYGPNMDPFLSLSVTR